MFVFGVATAICALHRSLPYHVLSKLNNEVFYSQPSTSYLNHVLEKVKLAIHFLWTSLPYLDVFTTLLSTRKNCSVCVYVKHLRTAGQIFMKFDVGVLTKFVNPF